MKSRLRHVIKHQSFYSENNQNNQRDTFIYTLKHLDTTTPGMKPCIQRWKPVHSTCLRHIDFGLMENYNICISTINLYCHGFMPTKDILCQTLMVIKFLSLSHDIATWKRVRVKCCSDYNIYSFPWLKKF